MSEFYLLQRFINYLQIERNASPKTREAYERDIIQFLQFCCKEWSIDEQGFDYNRMDRLAIRLWLGSLMKSGLAKSTLARKTASLRSFLKFLFKRGLISYNPAHLLMNPKKEHRLPVSIRPEEITLLMESVQIESVNGKRDLAILELLYSTGIRLNELICLDINDINLSRKRVKVTGKGAKERVVPFGDPAMQAVSNYLKERILLVNRKTNLEDQKALFLTDSGKRMYPRFVQRKVSQYLSQVSEASKKSPHVIRHSFATHLLERGAGIRVIKELLGHRDLAATQIYTGTSVEHLRMEYLKAHPRAESDKND